MTFAALKTLAKQALGNRNVTSDSDTWYGDRVNSAYRRITTFSGPVKRAGMRQPQMRAPRFFELMDSVSNLITSALTDNFVTPATDAALLFAITAVYDITHDRYLDRPSKRRMMRLNPDATGVPRSFVPDGKDGALGYRIYPRPGSTDDNIIVRESIYRYPAALSADGDEPVIPEAWHDALWIGAAAHGARLLEWPEKSTEMEALFMDFIAERKSPVEEASHSGGRRTMYIGARWGG